MTMTTDNMTSTNEVKILIVEDSLTQAEKIKTVLEKNGFDVVVVNNGSDAIKEIKRKMPSLVISEIALEDMDGYELCRKIKTDGMSKDLPVVLMSFLSDPREIVKGLEFGVDNFIIKPIDEKNLLARIQYILNNLTQSDNKNDGINISFHEDEFTIKADPLKTIRFLISIYETAIQKNQQLEAVQTELKEVNEKFLEIVEFRTQTLRSEIFHHIQSAEKLKRSEEKYRSLVESTPDSIYMVDRASNYLFMNSSHLSRLNLPEHDYIGRNYSDFHSANDTVEFEKYIEQAFEKKQQIQHDYKDNEKFLLRTFNPVIDIESNIVTAVTVISTNITEQKLAEEERNKYIREKAKSDLYSFIITALPVFASSIPSVARNTLASTFAQRFEDNTKPLFMKEMAHLIHNPVLKNGSKEYNEELMAGYISWIHDLFSNIETKSNTMHNGMSGKIELLNCPWKTYAKGNPIFCLICRAMVKRSYSWTSIDGYATQKSSIANGLPTCIFEFSINNKNKKV